MFSNIKLIELILRIGIASTFIGHGILAIFVNPVWIKYLETVGFTSLMAERIMPVIGVIDLFVGLTILIKPFRIVILYAFIWTLATALIRPLSGETILMFFERASNFCAPFALYWLLYQKKMDDMKI